MSPRLALPVLLLLPLLVAAQDSEPVAPPEKPLITRTGDDTYRMGEIELNARLREVRLPVTVNKREGGPIEYILVHENGKVHEAIFRTPVSPLHLQIALELLKYESGEGDVFHPLLRPEDIEANVDAAKERGDAVEIRFLAEDGAELAAHETILDTEIDGPMTPGPWIYTGSRERAGTFEAETTGSIVAVYLDPLAMFNTAREGSEFDERWFARTDAIPPLGTPGTLVLRPAPEGGNAASE